MRFASLVLFVVHGLIERMPLTSVMCLRVLAAAAAATWWWLLFLLLVLLSGDGCSCC